MALALTTAMTILAVAAPASPAQAEPFKKAMDNRAPGFHASGKWKASSWNSQKVGKNYRYARPARVTDNAFFKMRLPRSTRYRVSARWPATRGYNTSTRIGVRTPSGIKWRRVDQSSKGGRWVRLGTFKLKSGNRQRVIISRRSGGKGYVIADAVLIKEVNRKSSKSPDRSGGSKRKAVIREARDWLGTPYRYGGASRRGVDCSGLTMRVFERVNKSLPRTAAAQYRRGRPTRSPIVGDLAFGDYTNSGNIGHVGIYAGRKRMINAPYPGTVVRYDTVQSRYHVGYRNLLS